MSKPYVVGIDIGGTNTVFGIVNEAGQILHQGHIKTIQGNDVITFINNLYEGLWPLIQMAGGPDKIAGIGVGAPDANYFTGIVEHAPNLPWGDFVPLAKLMKDRFGIATVITNDANAAAIGEMTYGAARGMKDFIMITLGTGLGSGIVANGQLVYGHDGFAGELGHVIVRRENGRLCGCGRKGCLEAYCSATGYARTAQEWLRESDRPSLLRSLDVEKVTSKDIHDAALQGDELALEVFQYCGKILGETFADFVTFTSPEAFILFGGVIKSGEMLRKPIVEAMENALMKNFKNKIKIIFSELKESDAAVLGSSAMGWDAESWKPRG